MSAENLPSNVAKGIVAFDMDGTLIKDRVIFIIGSRLGIENRIMEIMELPIPAFQRSLEIARLLGGMKESDFTEAMRDIRTVDGAEETLATLRSRGFRVGIISDSYTHATGYLAEKLKMDFNVANELVAENGILTGQVRMPLGWGSIGCDCQQSVCKRYHLRTQALRFSVPLRSSIAVGDNLSDLCMIKEAGVSVAFNSKTPELERAADHVIFSSDLSRILEVLQSI